MTYEAEVLARLGEAWREATPRQMESLPPYLRKWAKEHRREPVCMEKYHVTSSIDAHGDVGWIENAPPTDEDVVLCDLRLREVELTYRDGRHTSIVNNFTSAYYDKDEGKMVRTRRSRKVREVSEAPERALEKRDGFLSVMDRYLQHDGTHEVERAYKGLQFILRQIGEEVRQARAMGNDKLAKSREQQAKRQIVKFYAWLDENNLVLAEKHVREHGDDATRTRYYQMFTKLDELNEDAEDKDSYTALGEHRAHVLDTFVAEFGQVNGWFVRPEHLAVAPTVRR